MDHAQASHILLSSTEVGTHGNKCVVSRTLGGSFNTSPGDRRRLAQRLHPSHNTLHFRDHHGARRAPRDPAERTRRHENPSVSLKHVLYHFAGASDYE